MGGEKTMTEKIERIAVFDVLGPMYHYDVNGWINGALQPLVARLKKHGYKGVTVEEEAKNEEIMLRAGKEIPEIMPGFVETVLYLHEQRIRPVIVSAGTDWVLEHTLGLVAADYTQRTGVSVVPEQLVHPNDLISTIPIGSKRDPETWKKATRQYRGARVVAIYEDTFANCIAAKEGLHARRGYHVTSTKNGLAVLMGDNTLYRGHMEENLAHLKTVVGE
jgi:hypothetical protein